ncbi:MEKHLA domain-containing protein [Dongia sedimenti]|uniref:MEKHLA domain-containing protein n=1 Tax=Dongia sedimenti TaxID=3064282 RepID=A0ABU0YST8_9PROT|nr:MEKHLA domain-containing protein [Rhodospirillaceae bacterium R-7]
MRALLRPRAADPLIFGLLTGSYARLVGRSLVPQAADPDWLYDEAPFAVLAHDTAADPRFFYANRAAQACFGYSWIEFVGMPSRLSAEAPERAARQALLDAVARDGYVADYRGVRIAKSGRRFWIEQAVVWELVDADGTRRGQAATFERWVDLSGRC